MCDVESQARITARIKDKFTINLLLRTIFHSMYFVWFVVVLSWGCYIWFTITDEQLKHPTLKDLKVLTPFFFTNWNFSFQTVFLGLSLLHDALEWLDKQSSNVGCKIRYYRDVIFCGMVLPFTLFVSGMFWAVYAIDRELVFPRIYDSVVPWWFNHCVHTNILAVLVVETLLQARRFPTNQKLELILYWAVAFSYAIVYYTIYFVTDRWLYQVFGVMNWWQVCLYQLFIWVMSYAFYKIQFPINRLVHGSEEAETIEVKPPPNNSDTNKIAEMDCLNEDGKNITDLNTPEDSWSLKFRNSNLKLENSRL